MNKKKTNIYLIFVGLIFIAAILFILLKPSMKKNERNTIVFYNSTGAVIDSLMVMNNFVQNLSLQINRKSGYYIDKGRFFNDLYIGGEKVVNIDDIKKSLIKSQQTNDSIELNVDNDEIFGILPDEILTRFIYLTIYLDNNHISSSYIDKYYNALIFGYRDTIINDDEEVRNIVFLDEIQDTTHFLNEVIVYDRKNGLILFSPYK